MYFLQYIPSWGICQDPFGILLPLYTVCPQLQDRNLQAELGVAEDPMRIIDALFSLPEQDALGGKALQFMGLLPERPQAPQTEEQAEDPADPGPETVKN